MTLPHPREKPGRIWKPALAALIIGIVLIVAGSCAYWLFRTPDRTARDAAHTIGVTIPPNATDVAARDDRIALGGTRCSDLQFLLPTGQWPTYVSGDMPAELTPTSNSVSNCSRGPRECSNHPGGSFDNYQARIGDNGVTLERAVLVIPDCEPGQTLIMWLTKRR